MGASLAQPTRPARGRARRPAHLGRNDTGPMDTPHVLRATPDSPQRCRKRAAGTAQRPTHVLRRGLRRANQRAVGRRPTAGAIQRPPAAARAGDSRAPTRLTRRGPRWQLSRGSRHGAGGPPRGAARPIHATHRTRHTRPHARPRRGPDNRHTIDGEGNDCEATRRL